LDRPCAGRWGPAAISTSWSNSTLAHAVNASRKIETITASTPEEAFLCGEILPAAVLHHLTVIGEAINRLSPELRARQPEVPWHQIVAVRQRIVHAYIDLDWQILWNAAMDDIPQLWPRISGILESEFAESGLT
jgi:uncharacterized protein with HEPN domain